MEDRIKHINKFIEKEIIKKIPKKQKFYYPKEEKPDEIEDVMPKKKKKKLFSSDFGVSGSKYLTVGSGDKKFKIEIKQYAEDRKKLRKEINIGKVVLTIAAVFILGLFVYLAYMNFIYENKVATYHILKADSTYRIESSGDAGNVVLKKISPATYFLSVDFPKSAKVLQFTCRSGASYYQPLATIAKGNNYNPTSTLREFKVPLRGDHIIYTYIKNEPLQWSFEFKDLNRITGKDEVNIEVFDMNNNLLLSQNVSDDGNEGNLSAIIGPVRSETIRLKNLKEGVYKIVIKTSGDTLITRMATIQSKFVFKNHLFLANNKEYYQDDTEQEIYSPGLINVSTYHDAGLQTFTAHGKTYQLTQKNSVVIAEGDAKFTKGDVVIDSSSNIAFSQELYFPVDKWHGIISTIPGEYNKFMLVSSEEKMHNLDISKISVPDGRIDILLEMPTFSDIDEIKLVFLRKAE